MPSFARILLLLALPGGLAAQPPAQDPAGAQPPARAQGTNTLRIDSDAKLDVPEAMAEEVWLWLRQRYAQPGWLDRGTARFSTTLGDEVFEDRYFDTPDLVLYRTACGIRHRTRVVLEGSRVKDGRQLLQLKLPVAGGDATARGEIKYEVVGQQKIRTADDVHPMLGLLGPLQRAECRQRLQTQGWDAEQMAVRLTLKQQRRRVYLADQHGPFATLTLDQARIAEWGTTVAFTEIELELNEIRYTEADAAMRRFMEEVRAAVRQDLLAAFPAIQQDQTPKYNKAFDRVLASSSLPVRRLIAWNLRVKDLLALLLLAVVVTAGAVAFVVIARRRARALRAA